MKRRIVIFVNGNGTVTARNTRQYDFGAWECEKANLHHKGFRQILGTINIPDRIDKVNGWNKFYRAWLGYAVHAYEI